MLKTAEAWGHAPKLSTLGRICLDAQHSAEYVQKKAEYVQKKAEYMQKKAGYVQKKTTARLIVNE